MSDFNYRNVSTVHDFFSKYTRLRFLISRRIQKENTATASKSPGRIEVASLYFLAILAVDSVESGEPEVDDEVVDTACKESGRFSSCV